MSKQNLNFFGPLYIMIGSSLWAVDAIFRTQLTFTIAPIFIVLIEHFIGFLILSPFLIKHRAEIKGLSLGDWGAVLIMTVVSSVLGTLLFTDALGKSFAQFDFATPILIQKLQPVFVILLSAIFLREKLTKSFLFWSSIALIGSYLISFGFQIVETSFQGKELVYLMSLGAAFSWGSGTILSKHILKKLSFSTLSALRFFFAVPVSFIFAKAMIEMFEFSTIQSPDNMIRFLVIAGITGGALAIYLYYKGLSTTDAKVSTIAELMFPIVSIGIAITPLNPYGEAQTLSVGNIVGIILLFSAISVISFFQKRQNQVQTETVPKT